MERPSLPSNIGTPLAMTGPTMINHNSAKQVRNHNFGIPITVNNFAEMNPESPPIVNEYKHASEAKIQESQNAERVRLSSMVESDATIVVETCHNFSEE